MQWIDIGANLTHDSFDADRKEVIARAFAAGVTQMLITGASVASSRAAIELSRLHAGRLFATAGVHPHHAEELTPAQLPALRALLQDCAVVAVGECGCTGGIFGEGYASCGRVSNVIPVDVAIPGCPPSPTRILQGILAALGRHNGPSNNDTVHEPRRAKPA